MNPRVSVPSSLASLTLLGLFLACAFFGLPGEASAQVIVYRISFEDLVGYNVDFFDGGYLVAPALGGAPSLVMVNRDAGGATYTAAASGGDFFIGTDRAKRLMATYSCHGAAHSALCAFGPVVGSIRLKSRTFDIQVRVARTMTGGMVVASSEDGQKGADGTIGFAQHSNVKMEIDAALTDEANLLGGESADAVSVVYAFLESNGFRPEEDPALVDAR